MQDGRGKILARMALVLAVALLLAPAGGFDPAWSQEKDATTWRFTWTPPSTGSPPLYYIAELRRDGTEVLTLENIGSTTLTVPVDYGHDYEFRVAAVDDQGRQGPFSDWSRRESCEYSPPSLD